MNMATLTHALLPIFPEESWVLVGYVWMGKFEYGKEKLRAQKYPDTCAQGLMVYPGTLKINRPVTGHVQNKEPCN